MMDFKSSQLMEKIARLTHKPVVLSGYVLTSSDDQNSETIRLYPALDPRCFYVFTKQSVVDILPASSSDQTTLLLRHDAEINVVSNHRISAEELSDRIDRGGICGCLPEGNDLGVIFAKKDLLRQQVVALAKMLLSLGVKEIDCKKMDSMTAACCNSWNRLLGAVAAGGSGFDEANWLLTACYGIG